MAHRLRRPSAAIGHRTYRTVALTLWLGALAGCAGVHWERALYEGVRSGHPTCARDTAARPHSCQPLPAYDDYARERARVRASSP